MLIKHDARGPPVGALCRAPGPWPRRTKTVELASQCPLEAMLKHNVKRQGGLIENGEKGIFKNDPFAAKFIAHIRYPNGIRSVRSPGFYQGNVTVLQHPSCETLVQISVEGLFKYWAGRFTGNIRSACEEEQKTKQGEWYYLHL